MALNIIEFFGYHPKDQSEAAVYARKMQRCPFVPGKCIKTFNDGVISGACTLRAVQSGPVICCPHRLYANEYKILKYVASTAFGDGVNLVPMNNIDGISTGKKNVVIFGKRWGKELRLPQRKGSGGYFVDWVLAHIGPDFSLKGFVAVEVQSIDTTGNYRAERDAYMKGAAFSGKSKAGFNWENVSKRILPQIIYKGHVLRREPLCNKGLFFISPTPVYQRIIKRLGDDLLTYSHQPGALTFVWYDIGEEKPDGELRELLLKGTLITTVDQVANAFTSPRDLPPERVYEKAIEQELKNSGNLF